MKEYERTETFVFKFTDERVFKEFFTKYFQGKNEGMAALSCAVGNRTQKLEDAENLLRRALDALDYKHEDLNARIEEHLKT